MSHSLTLIKLGGSVITNKEVPMMVRQTVLERLVREVARAYKKTNGNNGKNGQSKNGQSGNGQSKNNTNSISPFVIGHGQGSFAHAPALRYQTMEGFIKKDSKIGMAITQDSAAQLNRIVVKAFIAAQLPAVTFMPSNSVVTKNRQAQHWCHHVLGEYLENGLLPITGGDVLVDIGQGCTIWSTEKVFAFLAKTLDEVGYSIDRIIHVAEVDGVLDIEGKVIPEVTLQNLDQVKKEINGTKGFDVTGGMLHKLEESLALAEHGLESVILSGMKKDNLYKCLVGEEFEGTVIH